MPKSKQRKKAVVKAQKAKAAVIREKKLNSHRREKQIKEFIEKMQAEHTLSRKKHVDKLTKDESFESLSSMVESKNAPINDTFSEQLAKASNS